MIRKQRLRTTGRHFERANKGETGERKKEKGRGWLAVAASPLLLVRAKPNNTASYAGYSIKRTGIPVIVAHELETSKRWMPPSLKFVNNMAELSPEEFRKSLFQTFRSRGVLEALKVG